MYFLLAGHPPFNEGTLAQRIARHQTQMPKPLREVCEACPQELADICTKMIQKDPRDRQSTCNEIVDQISNWLTRNGYEAPGSWIKKANAAVSAPSVAGEDSSSALPDEPIEKNLPDQLHKPAEPNTTPISLTETTKTTGDSVFGPTTTVEMKNQPAAIITDDGKQQSDSRAFSFDIKREVSPSRSKRHGGASSKDKHRSARPNGKSKGTKSKGTKSARQAQKRPIWLWVVMGVGVIVAILGIVAVLSESNSPTQDVEPKQRNSTVWD